MRFSTCCVAIASMATALMAENPGAHFPGFRPPARMVTFYDRVKAQGECGYMDTYKGLGGSHHPSFVGGKEGEDGISYCHDRINRADIIYLKRRGGGNLAEMQVSCNGKRGSDADDGACNNETITPTYWPLEAKRRGFEELDPFVHSFVNYGNLKTSDHALDFDPRDHGIQPYALMAIMCNRQRLIYGFWGDSTNVTNVGKASVAVADLCFGDRSSHQQSDVLYIAFPEQDPVVGRANVDWRATSAIDFQYSLAKWGQNIVYKNGDS